MQFQEYNGKTRLLVKLTPGASANKLLSLEVDLLGEVILRAMVTAIPEKGLANRALLKLLSKSLSLPKSAFQMVRGELSRSKVFEIDSAPEGLHLKFNALGLL